jgi:hypothetical protein
MYPMYGRCGSRHPEDCSTTLGRCYICRGEGHRLWRDCQYLGRGCFYCRDAGHKKRDCPCKAVGAVQSQQQSVTVDQPTRPTQIPGGEDSWWSISHILRGYGSFTLYDGKYITVKINASSCFN